MTSFRFLIAAAVLAACGGQQLSITPAGSSQSLHGTSFRSVAVTEDGTARALVPDTRIELTFGTDDTVAMKAGCNQMSGPMTVTDDRLHVGQITTTNMACDQSRMSQDQWLADFIQAEPTWRLDGSELVLTTDRTQIRLETPAAASLLGTRWVVTGLAAGSGDTSSVADGVEAYLTFDGSQVTGSTGCNRLTGTATMRDDSVELGAIATTKMACSGAADDVERAVTRVLASGTIDVTLEGDTLRLTGDGSGLILTASS